MCDNSATWLQPPPYWRLKDLLEFQDVPDLLNPPDLHDLQDLRPRPPKIIWTLLFCLGLMCNNSTAWLQPPPY